MLSEKQCSQLFDGNMKNYKIYSAGVYRGFYVTVGTTVKGMFSVKISAHSQNDPENAALRSFAESRMSEVKQILSVDVSDNCVTVEVARAAFTKNVVKKLNEAVIPFIDFLAGGCYLSGCMHCGTQYSQIDCYCVTANSLEPLYLCSDCIGKVEESLLDRKQSILAKKSNLIAGIVGALLGSMIGCVVYFLIYQLGYVAAIAGLVTAVCTFKGYEMLGGAIDRKGVIACVIVMIFAVFFANKLAWAYDAFRALKDYDYTFFDCFRYLNEIVAESEITDEYYSNLAMAYFLTAIGSFRNVMNAFMSTNSRYRIEKAKD